MAYGFDNHGFQRVPGETDTYAHEAQESPEWEAAEEAADALLRKAGLWHSEDEVETPHMTGVGQTNNVLINPCVYGGKRK